MLALDVSLNLRQARRGKGATIFSRNSLSSYSDCRFRGFPQAGIQVHRSYKQASARSSACLYRQLITVFKKVLNLFFNMV